MLAGPFLAYSKKCLMSARSSVKAPLGWCSRQLHRDLSSNQGKKGPAQQSARSSLTQGPGPQSLVLQPKAFTQLYPFKPSCSSMLLSLACANLPDIQIPQVPGRKQVLLKLLPLLERNRKLLEANAGKCQPQALNMASSAAAPPYSTPALDPPPRTLNPVLF